MFHSTAKTRRQIIIGALVLIAAVVGAYSLAAVNRSGGGENLVPWMTKYGQAVQKSRQTGKPLLIDYTASWCPPCQMMEDKVYSSQKMADRITDQFVPLKQDTDTLSPRENQLARHLGIYAIPTLVVRTAEGEELGRHGGFIPPSRLLAWFDTFETDRKSQ